MRGSVSPKLAEAYGRNQASDSQFILNSGERSASGRISNLLRTDILAVGPLQRSRDRTASTNWGCRRDTRSDSRS
jgi:hypothetical protein